MKNFKTSRILTRGCEVVTALMRSFVRILVAPGNERPPETRWARAMLMCSALLMWQAARAAEEPSAPTAESRNGSSANSGDAQSLAIGSPEPAVPPSSEPTAQDVDTSEGRWSLHGQTTYVWQRKNAFSAPYTGPQSLNTQRELGHTWSATGFFGARLWNGGEFYLNPEAVAGVPFSNLLGLGSVTNGELQKNSGPHPHAYIARAFLRQTFNLGGERLQIADGANQLKSIYDTRRFVVTAGKLTQTDIFERNAYANDPRSQFLNWAMITHGAWDYAGDARAYSIGIAPELYWDNWVLRFGRFMEPQVANGVKLNYQISRFHGDQFELEHDHKLGELPGVVRLLAYRNRASAGSYRGAIDAAAISGATPDVMSVRKDSNKIGFAISLEQRVAPDVGLFVRASTADSKVEEYAFTEIDNTLSGGVSVQGIRWGRPADTFGLAFATSGLSRDHRDYLAAGGLGGFLGDGQLPRYGRENLIEAYYKIQIVKGLALSLDFQQLRNPGFNAERAGPVRIFGARLHAEL